MQPDPLIPGETGTVLLVLAVFLLPGFVTQLFKERTHEARAPISAFERLLQSLYYSLLAYLPLAAAAAFVGWDKEQIERIYSVDEGLWALLGVAVLSGLVMPAVIAYLSLLWSESDKWRPRFFATLGARAHHRTPTAWDHFFQIEIPAFVRVTTRSGDVYGGYYGGLSFAGYGREPRDLYLEQEWELELDTNVFVRPVEWSIGVWIDGSEIVAVELYAVNEEEANAFKEVAESRTGD